MQIITLEGEALAALCGALGIVAGERPRTLRVASDVDGVKLKINEHTWSPPFPKCAEQVAREALNTTITTTRVCPRDCAMPEHEHAR